MHSPSLSRRSSSRRHGDCRDTHSVKPLKALDERLRRTRLRDLEGVSCPRFGTHRPALPRRRSRGARGHDTSKCRGGQTSYAGEWALGIGSVLGKHSLRDTVLSVRRKRLAVRKHVTGTFRRCRDKESKKANCGNERRGAGASRLDPTAKKRSSIV